MRKLRKLSEPDVLISKRDSWESAVRDNSGSEYAKTQYRHQDIKSRLKEETGSKCAYCESYIGHNTPGDIEHKIPVDHDESQRFVWANLTIACTECNRRKNDYWSDIEEERILDPYVDDVEMMLIHYGPIVAAQPGHKRAEITVGLLGLMDYLKRSSLIQRKIERLKTIQRLCERFTRETSPLLRRILEEELTNATTINAEYSMMVRTMLRESAPDVYAKLSTKVPDS